MSFCVSVPLRRGGEREGAFVEHLICQRFPCTTSFSPDTVRVSKTLLFLLPLTGEETETQNVQSLAQGPTTTTWAVEC